MGWARDHVKVNILICFAITEVVVQMTSEVVDEGFATFTIYKRYMAPWVDDLLGWDEQFQFNGFKGHFLQDNVI